MLYFKNKPLERLALHIIVSNKFNYLLLSLSTIPKIVKLIKKKGNIRIKIISINLKCVNQYQF